MKTTVVFLSALTSLTGAFATSAGATVIQITELGQVVSYTDDQFLTGNGGALLGTVGGYANDRGFLYVPVPQPSSAAMLAVALSVLALLFRRRRAHSAPSNRP